MRKFLKIEEMGKWDSLNSKLDEVLNSLTKEDWVKWDSEKSIKNAAKKEAISQRALLQATLISSNISCYRIGVGASIIGEEGYYEQLKPPSEKITNNLVKIDPNFFGSIFFSKLAA